MNQRNREMMHYHANNSGYQQNDNGQGFGGNPGDDIRDAEFTEK